MANSCGTCSLCCKLPAVGGLTSINEWCKHATPGKGCGIYADRPTPCSSYRCAYLQTDMPEHMRPDKLGVIFEAIADNNNAIVMRVPKEKFNAILQRSDILKLVSLFANAGTSVVMTNGVEAKLFQKDKAKVFGYVLLGGKKISQEENGKMNWKFDTPLAHF